MESYSYSNSNDSFENNNNNEGSASPHTFKTLRTGFSQGDFKSSEDIEQVKFIIILRTKKGNFFS
jgi:hypothetical protein